MPEFLSKLARLLKGRTSESQATEQKQDLNGSSGTETTLPGVAGSGDDRHSEPALQVRPLSAIEPTPSSAAISIAEGCLENAFLRHGNNPSYSGYFHNAQNTVLHHPVMIDQNITVVAGESKVMRKLSAYTDPNAAVDSSAREPVPTCHPKTRLEIRDKLAILLHDKDRKWKMARLFGAAGTGKSAVGQSFASECIERGELGAAFFFSRPNGRNKYTTVVPTLAYQLATHCPPYRLALIARIDYDDQIIIKKPSVQFKALIVEPLLEVQPQITTTYLMLLDGVDECGANMTDAFEREKEQRELVEMIAESVRDHPELPLFWLLCSRPEEHLQDKFSEIAALCRHEELIIDAKCREEVEMVLREGFAKIVKDRRIVAPGSGGWPSEEDFNTVECAVAGLHVFGAAILKDIEHSASPVRQLKSLIPFLEHVTGSSTARSIQVMDLFYARILGDVPEEDLPTTLRIIGTIITIPDPDGLSAQALCNFMRLDPNDFSSALRMVHSVINIPPPKEVGSEALRLYHASFSDFLTDASRSGRFFIDKQKILIDLIKSCFFWHGLHYHHFHRSPARPLAHSQDFQHNHGPLPQANFTWISSADNHRDISEMICEYGESHCFILFKDLKHDEELFSFLCNSDLRYMSVHLYENVKYFFNWVHEQDPSSGFIRMQPQSDEDRMLLTYLEILTKEPIPPARLPTDWHYTLDLSRSYLLLGRNSLSIIAWYTETPSGGFTMALNLDHEPDEDAIKFHEEELERVDWEMHNRNPRG